MFSFLFKSPKKETIMAEDIKSALRRYYLRTQANQVVVTNSVKNKEYEFTVVPIQKPEKRVIKVKCIRKTLLQGGANDETKQKKDKSKKKQKGGMKYPVFRILVKNVNENILKANRDKIVRVLAGVYDTEPENILLLAIGGPMVVDGEGKSLPINTAFIEYTVLGHSKGTLLNLNTYNLLMLFFHKNGIAVVGIMDETDGYSYSLDTIIRKAKSMMSQPYLEDESDLIPKFQGINSAKDVDLVQRAIQKKLITSEEYKAKIKEQRAMSMAQGQTYEEDGEIHD